jgi:hypothetical protein
MGLPFISKSADEGHRVRVIPALAGGKAAQSVRRARGSLAQDDRIAGHEDVKSVARLDVELAARLARHDDLVLGADLDA